MRNNQVRIIEDHKCRPVIRSEKGKFKIGGQKYRYTKEGEKSALYKVIEQPKKEEENNDNT